MHYSSLAIAWEWNSYVRLVELHPTSLLGNEIPTKWLGNEIPTNHPSELYTIYNPASCTVSQDFLKKCHQSLGLDNFCPVSMSLGLDNH